MSALPTPPTAASVAIDAQNALIDKGHDVEFSRDGASGALILTVGARSARIRMVEGGRILVSIGPDDLAPLDPVALLTWWLPPPTRLLMCYSAQIRADYRDYTRMFGAQLSIKDFVKVFYGRQDAKLKIPKAMEAAFERDAVTPEELDIKRLIETFKADRAMTLEQELFAQRKRLADAERTLQTKQTKAALESQRIATSKISKARLDLDDLRRTELLDRDSRIFPGVYAPVMVVRDGQRVVLPMRYQCRPAGKPADYDIKFPGTYNARRDNLEGFWRGQFGYTHGILLVDTFYENVKRHDMEHRQLAPDEKPENVILQFTPNPPELMYIACLWSHWTRGGEPDLLSFAAITDEPPQEVADAGHDRMIIRIKPEHVDAWLNPDPNNLKALYDIFDDRTPAFYEHRQAA
jgi:putative SOS response-associated peptidase YedK